MVVSNNYEMRYRFLFGLVAVVCALGLHNKITWDILLPTFVNAACRKQGVASSTILLCLLCASEFGLLLIEVQVWDI